MSFYVVFYSKDGNFRTESVRASQKGRKSKLRIELVDKSENQNMYMKHPMMTLKQPKN